MTDHDPSSPVRSLYSPPATGHLTPDELAARTPARGGAGSREEAPAGPRERPPLLDPSAPPPRPGEFGRHSAAVERFLDGLSRLGPAHFADVADWVPAPADSPVRDEKIDDFNNLVRTVRQFATLDPRIGRALLAATEARTQRAPDPIRPKVARFAWLAALAIAFADSLPASDRAWMCAPFALDVPTG